MSRLVTSETLGCCISWLRDEIHKIHSVFSPTPNTQNTDLASRNSEEKEVSLSVCTFLCGNVTGLFGFSFAPEHHSYRYAEDAVRTNMVHRNSYIHTCLPARLPRFLYHTTILQRSIAILQRSIGVTVGPHGVPGVWDHACG